LRDKYYTTIYKTRRRRTVKSVASTPLMTNNKSYGTLASSIKGRRMARKAAGRTASNKLITSTKDLISIDHLRELRLREWDSEFKKQAKRLARLATKLQKSSLIKKEPAEAPNEGE
jgi:hypothetical protein